MFQLTMYIIYFTYWYSSFNALTALVAASCGEPENKRDSCSSRRLVAIVGAWSQVLWAWFRNAEKGSNGRNEKKHFSVSYTN